MTEVKNFEDVPCNEVAEKKDREERLLTIKLARR